MTTLSKKAILFTAPSSRAIANGGNAITANTIYDFANNEDFSLALGVRLLRSESQVLIGKRASTSTEGYELRITNGQVIFTLFDTGGGEMTVSAGSVGEYPVGTELHIVATWEGTSGNDASNAAIYIDGVSATLDPVTDTLSATISNAGVWQLSGVFGANSQVTNGILDWVCVYSSVLSPATVTSLYASGDLANPIEVQTANLLAFYPIEFDTFDKAGAGDRHLKNLIANGASTASTNIELVDFSINRMLAAGANVNIADTPVSTLGGISNRCFAPNGTTERWNIIDANVPELKFDQGSTWSASFWFFDDDLSAVTQVFFGKRLESPSFRGWDVRRQGSAVLGVLIPNDNATSDKLVVQTVAAFNDSTWHHCVVTVDGTDTEAGVKFYVDGATEAVTLGGFTLTGTYDNTADFKISGFVNPMRSGLRLAEVQIFNTVIPLTAGAGVTSVATLFNSGAPTYPNDWFGPQAPIYNTRPGEEHNHLNMVGMQDEDVIEVAFGEFGGGGIAVVEFFQMRGIDTGDPSQPSPHTWVVIDDPDPTGAQATGPDAPPFGGPLTNIIVAHEWTQ